MGYTTDFEGEFTLDRAADEDTAAWMERLADTDYRDPAFPKGAPAAWMQWRLSDDRMRVCAEGEKFYEYTEWLQWLIDNEFKPSGRILSGKVLYRGESAHDCGTIESVDGNVIKTPAVSK